MYKQRFSSNWELDSRRLPFAFYIDSGVTFPFNLLIGIPLYFEIAKVVSGSA